MEHIVLASGFRKKIFSTDGWLWACQRGRADRYSIKFVAYGVIKDWTGLLVIKQKFQWLDLVCSFLRTHSNYPWGWVREPVRGMGF